MSDRHLSRSISQRTFKLGQVVATPAALAVLKKLNVSAWQLISRHYKCDWGDLCDEDRELNNHSLSNGLRIFSSYKLTASPGDGTTTETVWVITEADRASTTILLPSEY